MLATPSAMRYSYLFMAFFSCTLPCDNKRSPKTGFTHGANTLRENKIYEMHVESLLRVLSFRDVETEEHTRRVTTLMLSFAHLWDIPKERLFHIRWGAQLHDIGKIGIPDAILHKTGSLTVEEQAVIRMHPIYAYELLYPVSYLRPALDIPYCHHEKWDGSGYPQGLKGNQIPLAARLFAIVDVWDALLSNRPYRNAWSTDKTIAYIRDQSGRHFDPEVVGMFGKFLGSFDRCKGINVLISLESLLYQKQDSILDFFEGSID
jgi:HD-GYP domain-containing protein (c-di-GMP phosphodiesterase class II)